MLPQRTCEDISRQLQAIATSEESKSYLKKLLNSQKKITANELDTFNFDKDIHYKCPLKQSVKLPSIYTVSFIFENEPN
jgi:hypothetical protein